MIAMGELSFNSDAATHFSKIEDVAGLKKPFAGLDLSLVSTLFKYFSVLRCLSSCVTLPAITDLHTSQMLYFLNFDFRESREKSRIMQPPILQFMFLRVFSYFFVCLVYHCHFP